MKRTSFAVLLSLCMALGCMGAPDPEEAQLAPESSSAEHVSSMPEEGSTSQGICLSYFCHNTAECPACPGSSAACIAGVCQYTPDGSGGDDGDDGGLCPTSFCRRDSDCAAACPSSPQPRCIANTCSY